MKDCLIFFNARIVTPTGNISRKGKEMSQLTVIENGEVEIQNGIITYVGEKRHKYQGSGLYDGIQHQNLHGRCLLPGFVDSHTHLVFGGLRAEEFSWRLKGESYMSIMNRGGGIASTVDATRKTSLKDLRESTGGLLKKMFSMGVTTVEGKSGYGLDFDTEVKQLQVMKSLNEMDTKRVDIVPTFLGAHAVPLEYKGRNKDYIDFLINVMLPYVKSHDLAENCDVFCEKGVFSIKDSRRLLKAAQEQGFNVKIHADEIVSLGGAELAGELHALSADHLLHASNAGIKAMAENGVVATLLPLTAFALKEHYARGREMIDAGCAVALATDLNPGSCFSGSIPLTIALACIYMGLSIEEVITALTLNGAAAVNRADSIGTIEVGKKGDCVVLNSDDYNILPYYVGMNCVLAVVKNGNYYSEKRNK